MLSLSFNSFSGLLDLIYSKCIDALHFERVIYTLDYPGMAFYRVIRYFYPTDGRNRVEIGYFGQKQGKNGRNRVKMVEMVETQEKMTKTNYIHGLFTLLVKII